MIKRVAALLAVMFAIGSASALACPADKGKLLDGKTDSGQMSKPGTNT